MTNVLKTRTLKQYSSVSLTTSTQTQSTEIIQPLGDVVGLDLRLTVSATGTLTGAQNILKAINNITVVDKDGLPILDVAGNVLDELYLWMNPIGDYISPPTVTSGGESWNTLLNLPIKITDQPAKVQVVFAPYSDLATSGATGGTVSLTIAVWYGVTPATLRVYSRSLSISSGDNALGIQLVDSKNTVFMGFTIGTESNINNVTFSSDGKIEEYSKIALAQLTDREKTVYVDGHQTGIFNLFVSPLQVQIDKTQFTVNAGGSDTVVIYQIATN